MTNNFTTIYKPSTRREILANQLQFICTPGAIFTFRNKETHNGFTYRTRAPRDGQTDIVFIDTLTRPGGDYKYIGFIRGGRFHWCGAQDPAQAKAAPAVAAFQYVANEILALGKRHPGLEIFSERS